MSRGLGQPGGGGGVAVTPPPTGRISADSALFTVMVSGRIKALPGPGWSSGVQHFLLPTPATKRQSIYKDKWPVWVGRLSGPLAGWGVARAGLLRLQRGPPRWRGRVWLETRTNVLLASGGRDGGFW